VTAERGVLSALGGGCQVPIGAYATVHNGHVKLVAIVASPDGTKLIRGEGEGPDANAATIGQRLGVELLNRGAAQILEAVYG
jgi:hydroxymethylbilane synthase